MSTYDNAYSQLVAWLKIALPLVALVLLSTLFLFSRGVGVDQQLPFSEVELEERARDTRITAPRFSGVMNDGATIEITAETARPDSENSNMLAAEQLSSHIEVPGGAAFDVHAPEGIINGDSRHATLRGGVVIDTSTGYQISSDTLTLNAAESLIEGQGEIDVDGPLGNLRSDAFRLAPAQNPDDGYLLVFNGRVKLIYTPQE